MLLIIIGLAIWLGVGFLMWFNLRFKDYEKNLRLKSLGGKKIDENDKEEISDEEWKKIIEAMGKEKFTKHSNSWE